MNNTMSKEKLMFYETILSGPGMIEKCKITLQLSRQNILILSRLIEAGLLAKEQSFDDPIIHALPNTAMEEYKTIHEEILRKTELTEFYQRLKAI